MEYNGGCQTAFTGDNNVICVIISSSCHVTGIFTDQLVPHQAANFQQLSHDQNIHWSADSAPSSLFPAAVTWPEYTQISWFRNKQLISSSCHVTRIFPDQLIPWQAAYFFSSCHVTRIFTGQLIPLQTAYFHQLSHDLFSRISVWSSSNEHKLYTLLENLTDDAIA